MYEYKYVTIELSTWTRKPKEDYHDVIEEHARNGWRLVQQKAPQQARIIMRRHHGTVSKLFSL